MESKVEIGSREAVKGSGSVDSAPPMGHVIYAL